MELWYSIQRIYYYYYYGHTASKLQKFSEFFFLISTYLHTCAFSGSASGAGAALARRIRLAIKKIRSMSDQMISRYYTYNIVVIFSLNKEMLCINVKCNPSFYSVCLRLLVGMGGIP